MSMGVRDKWQLKNPLSQFTISFEVRIHLGAIVKRLPLSMGVASSISRLLLVRGSCDMRDEAHE